MAWALEEKREGDSRQRLRGEKAARVKTGRDGRDAATSREAPEAGGGKGRSSPELLEGALPCRHLDLRLLAPELGEDTFLLFAATPSVVICYSSTRKLIHLAGGKINMNPTITQMCRI